MKKILGLLMMLGLMVSFGGCGKDTPTGPQGQTIEVYHGENEDGDKIEYQFYRNGNELIKHGYYKEYGEDGQKWKEGNYKDGEKDGKWFEYYEDGQIKWEINYKDGKWDGKRVKYYENRQIMEEGNYKDGKQEGKWVKYDVEGNITDEYCYDMGEEVDCPDDD